MLMQKWTVEIEVADTWVADGFELDAERLHNVIMSGMLGYAYDNEVKVKIIGKPEPKVIREIQGYGPGDDVIEDSEITNEYPIE